MADNEQIESPFHIQNTRSSIGRTGEQLVEDCEASHTRLRNVQIDRRSSVFELGSGGSSSDSESHSQSDGISFSVGDIAPLPVSESEVARSSEGSKDSPAALRSSKKKSKIAEQRYKARIDAADDAVAARFEANACPREVIKSFRNLGLLGAGSYGDVYLVEYSKDRENYALKVQEKSDFTEAFEREGLIREKKLMYAMQNDFIVKVFFAFQDNVNLYLVMEPAKYGDFGKFQGKQMPEYLVKLYTAQLILALEYIHACSIVHRDIKLANVLIFEDLYLKLADFGVSKRVNGRTTTFVGNPANMAPEILRREEYGPEVDWWGAGLFIFELIFGEHPFSKPGWERPQIMDAIVNLEVTFPERNDVSLSVRSLVLGLLQKDQSRRLGTLREGTKDLRRHEWFRGISFVDIFSKNVTIPIHLDPVRPKEGTTKEFPDGVAVYDEAPTLFEGF